MNPTPADLDILFSRLSPRVAAEWGALPLSLDDRGHVQVAVVDPDNSETLRNLEWLFERPIARRHTTSKDFKTLFLKRFGLGADALESGMVAFVGEVLRQAHQSRATDIHIEPFNDEILVRFRIDGLLHPVPVPPSLTPHHRRLVSRVKIMADMSIAEQRLPQDGRIRFNVDGEELDIRVSTLPTLHGESLDLRLLPRHRALLGLEELGMQEDHRDALTRLIRRPNGIFLVTGPTGHGKTTTLYASLSRINTSDKKIITIEDPVEIQLKGVNQMPVHARIGLNFAEGLRAILRQDPDIIMVGEIRDAETAEIAIRASLTGHLVFSTLHTNSAIGAVTRLIDMGIEPYLVASSLNAVLAQRLVRVRCPVCRGNNSSCEACHGTGYRGRTGLFELLEIDETLRHLILERAPVAELKKQAHTNGFRTLAEDGRRKIDAGLTTPEEVVRVTEEIQ